MLFVFINELISQIICKVPNVLSEEVSIDTLVKIVAAEPQSCNAMY